MLNKNNFIEKTHKTLELFLQIHAQIGASSNGSKLYLASLYERTKECLITYAETLQSAGHKDAADIAAYVQQLEIVGNNFDYFDKELFPGNQEEHIRNTLRKELENLCLRLQQIISITEYMS